MASRLHYGPISWPYIPLPVCKYRMTTKIFSHQVVGLLAQGPHLGPTIRLKLPLAVCQCRVTTNKQNNIFSDFRRWALDLDQQNYPDFRKWALNLMSQYRRKLSKLLAPNLHLGHTGSPKVSAPIQSNHQNC